MRRKMQSQPRIHGITRDSLPSCVVGEIKRAVEKDALRHSVSKSWVVAVILANHYKIDIPEYR